MLIDPRDTWNHMVAALSYGGMACIAISWVFNVPNLMIFGVATLALAVAMVVRGKWYKR